MRTFALIGGLLVLVLAAFAIWVRVAPVTPSRWHIDLVAERPSDLPVTPLQPDSLVRPLANGAWLEDPVSTEKAQALLLKLDAVALATPRTRRIAGSPQDGHVTWETRSALWGFPDYTTAQVTPQGLTVYARLRFGASDLGVNAKRLTDWLSRL